MNQMQQELMDFETVADRNVNKLYDGKMLRKYPRLKSWDGERMEGAAGAVEHQNIKKAA